MTGNSSYVSSPVTEYLCGPFPFLSLFFQKEYSLQPKCPSGSRKPGSHGSGECGSRRCPTEGFAQQAGRGWGFCAHPALLSPWLGNTAGLGDTMLGCGEE